MNDAAAPKPPLEAGINLTLKHNVTGELAESRVLVETPSDDAELMGLLTRLAEFCGSLRTRNWTVQHVRSVVFNAPVGLFEKWKETPPSKPAAEEDTSHGQ